MKFSVYQLIVVLSVVECIAARKGWDASGYKDEETCSMGWSGYLKRLSLIIFMLSGVILYYVPESRFYFRRGCHDIVDFVADGLQAGLNDTDTEYTVDDSSSSYTEQGSEETFGKRTSRRSTDIIEGDHVQNEFFRNRASMITFNAESSNESLLNGRIHLAGTIFDRNDYPYHCHLHNRERRNLSFDKFPTREDSTKFPFESGKLCPDEIIELEKFSKSRYFCPSERDSDTSDAISRGFPKNRQKKLYSRDDESTGSKEYFVIAEETCAEERSVLESEPTVYPEEESIYNATSDRENDIDCCRLREEIEKNFKIPTKLDRKLLEFDRTLRDMRSSFSRKYSAKSVKKEEYAVRIIETILQSVKRSFGEVDESEKNANRRRHRKSRGTSKNSVLRRAKKPVSSDHQDRNFAIEALADHCFYPSSRLISSSKRKFRTSLQSNICEDSRRGYSSFFLRPEDTMDVPVITSRVKLVIERAARWFFGRCPSLDCETPGVGNVGIVENNWNEKTT